MRALMVGQRDQVTRNLRQVVIRGGYECNESDVVDAGLGVEYAGRLRVDLIVIVLPKEGGRGLGVVSEIRGVTQATVIVVGVAEDPKWILRVLHEGADEYVDAQEADIELERVLQRLKLRRDSAGGTGLVTCLIGTVGGAGTSTLGANLAVALAQRDKAVLFDLGLRANDLATLLDLKPRHSIADLCRREHRLDQTMFQQGLAEHPSGVKLLTGPWRADDRVGVTSDGIRRCISMARGAFDHVLLDVDRSLGAEQLAAVVRADLILLIVRLDVIALRNTALMLEILHDLGIRREQIRLVANRTGQRYSLAPKRFEQVVDMPLWYAVRDDVSVANRAMNDGRPALQIKPRSWLARAARELAGKLRDHAGQGHAARRGEAVQGSVTAGDEDPARSLRPRPDAIAWPR